MSDRTISHYRVLQKVGRGGMGVVYKALDTRLDRMVALKFLPADRLDEPAARQRFRQEAQAASRLDHPNICTIFAVEELDDGRMFIAMAYYEGETLRERLERSPLAAGEVVHLMLEVARGLEAAHQQGIVHRDIKPENLMLTPSGTVKILDFGVAKWSEGEGLTQAGKALGTTRYMAPEALRGRPIDGRSDLWSLGVVVYEALCGAPPFDAAGQSNLILSILMDAPKPLAAPDDPGWEAFEPVILRALAKDPAERYQRAAEIVEDLERISGAPPTGAPALRTRAVAAAPAPAAVAILPFEDLSPDRDQEYFCCGLAEELMFALGRVPGLRVASRTSSVHLAGHGGSLREIGRQLDVAHLLEGSVRKAGTRLRITVRLIESADGYQLWAERYDREMADLFAVQDEIAQQVVEALRGTLTGEVETTRRPPQPRDLETYNLYLQGRFFCNKRTEADLEKAIGFFRQVIGRDPSFARASAGLADSLALLGLYGARRPEEVMPQAQEAADRALELDPDLAEVYVSRAAVRAVYDWNLPAASLDCQRAMDRDPGCAAAYHWNANFCLLPLARFEHALEQLHQARRLDPLSLPIHASVGLAYFFSRRFAEAVKEYRKTLEIDPGFGLAHFFLGQALHELGSHREAVAEFQRALQLSGERPEMIAGLGVAYARGGAMGRAVAIQEQLRRLGQQRYVSPVLTAQLGVALGKLDHALEDLERARELRASDLIWLRVRPAFDPLRAEPRFRSLLAALGLGEKPAPDGVPQSATLRA